MLTTNYFIYKLKFVDSKGCTFCHKLKLSLIVFGITDSTITDIIFYYFQQNIFIATLICLLENVNVL